MAARMLRRATSLLASVGCAATLMLCLAACAGSPTGQETASSDIVEFADGGLPLEAEAATAAELFRLQILRQLDQQQQQQHEEWELEAPAAGRHRPGAAPASLTAATAVRSSVRRKKPADRSGVEAAFAADSSENAWAADDGAHSDVPSVVHLRSEKGSLLPRERGSTVVFTLKQLDRDLRPSSVHLSFRLAERGQPSVKVEVVHRIDDGAYKTESVGGSLHKLVDGRYSFDIEAARLRDSLDRTGRLELLIRCTNCSAVSRGGRVVVGHHAALLAGSPLDQRPEAVVITEAELVIVGKKPSRRPADDQSAGACDGQCCLRKLEVDFDQLGDAYSWIVRPRRFHANYCAGSCSGGLPDGVAQQNRTAQAIVVDLMLRRQGKSLGSCCVATGTRPVHLIYRDRDGQFRTDTSQLYTTTSCACS